MSKSSTCPGVPADTSKFTMRKEPGSPHPRDGWGTKSLVANCLAANPLVSVFPSATCRPSYPCSRSSTQNVTYRGTGCCFREPSCRSTRTRQGALRMDEARLRRRQEVDRQMSGDLVISANHSVSSVARLGERQARHRYRAFSSAELSPSSADCLSLLLTLALELGSKIHLITSPYPNTA